MESNEIQIIFQSGASYNIPVWLDNTIDDMGVMVGFDGNVAIEEHLCDFTYSGTTGNTTLHIYNTAEVTSLRSIVEANFTINWGDGHTDDSSLSLSGATKDCFGITNTYNLTAATHTYTNPGTYVVSVSLLTPWKSQIVKKTITVPIPLDIYKPTFPFGSFNTIPIPSSINVTGQTINQTNSDLDNFIGPSTGQTISFAAFGKSRVSELKLYGGGYSGLTIHTGSTPYTAYTIDNLTYFDYPDGLTHITGNTSNFYFESVIDKMITRNEHFIGFIDEPIIYSDIFVKRGQQSVLEPTLRLSEIDNTGLLTIYGNGYFNIRKQ